MKVELTKDWCMNMAKIEDDAERWSVEDVLLVVSTYGPWGADLNGVHKQEIILADEVERLRSELADTALRSADHLRRAIKAEAKCDQMHAELEDLKRCHSNNVRNLIREADDLRDLLHRMLEAPTTQISVGWKRELQQALVRK